MIDTMLYFADIPAGTYAVGDEITLNLKSGPAVVRDGLGQPVLKDINTGLIFKNIGNGSKIMLNYEIQNQNWNDPVYNGTANLDDIAYFSEESRGVQTGNDCPLMVNSAFTVKAIVKQAITTTVDTTAFCSIDIEYPNIAGVQDPQKETGTPMSIEYQFENYTTNLCGTGASALWVPISVDKFKAGYRYLMQKLSVCTEGSGVVAGFLAISGGASMGGLRRIIPISSYSGALSKRLKYASVEVKGPVTLEALFFIDGTAATTANLDVIADYVKRM